MHRSSLQRIPAALLLLAAAGVLAGPEDGSGDGAAAAPPGVVQRPGAGGPPGPVVLLDTAAAHSFAGDVRGTDGQIASTTAATRLTLVLPLSPRVALTVPLDAALRTYAFDGDPRLGAGGTASPTPWTTVRSVSLGLGARWRIDERWAGLAAVNLASTGTTGSTLGDTFTGGGTLGATVQLAPTLTLGAFVTVQSRPSRGVLVLPLPVLDWTLPFDDGRWSLVLGGARAGAGRVAGAGVQYRPTAAWQLDAGFAFLGLGDFRLSSTARSGLAGGAASDFTVPLVLSATWQLLRPLTLGLSAGVNLFRSVKTYDAGGTELASRDVSPSALLGGSLSFVF